MWQNQVHIRPKYSTKFHQSLIGGFSSFFANNVQVVWMDVTAGINYRWSSRLKDQRKINSSI